MSLAGDLLQQAALLAGLDGAADVGAPKQADLRRAVSAAYYALFHHLIGEACFRMVGTSNDLRPLRDKLARTFDHGVMREACGAIGSVPARPWVSNFLGGQPHPDLQVVADAFVSLQQERHAADYDRARRFTRPAVRLLVQRASDAVTRIGPLKGRADTDLFLFALLVGEKNLKR